MNKLAVLAPPGADPVDALIRSIRIPPRPSLLADLQRELASSDPSPAAIGGIISSDVGMSGALLKLANSSFYGSQRTAKSIDQAIIFLGINQVAALMTGLLARQAIASDSVSLAAFWDLSTRRAQALVFLSRRLRIGAPDVAHTFGLFCDTGVALLLDRFPGYAATFEAAAGDSARRFTEVEDERHSTNHAAIGCLLARNWGLSSDVSWAILHHHDYSVIDDGASDDAVRSLVARRCWPSARCRPTRAIPARSSGTRAASAPAPTSACRPTRPPTCSTGCSTALPSRPPRRRASRADRRVLQSPFPLAASTCNEPGFSTIFSGTP